MFWKGHDRKRLGLPSSLHFTPALEPLEDRCLPSAFPAATPGTLPVGGESRDAVTVGSSVTLYSITPNRSLYRHDDTNGWVKLGDNIVECSAVAEDSGNAVVFALTGDHALFRFDSRNGWRMLSAPGTVQAMGAGTDPAGLANVYVLTQNGSFTRWTESGGWLASPLGAPGTILQWTALAKDRVAVVSADHSVFEYDDTFGWFRLTGPGFAQALSAVNEASGGEVLFAETPGHGLFRYDGKTGWSRVGAEGTIQSLSAGLDASGRAEVWVTTTAEDFFVYDASLGWAALHAPGSIAEVNATSLGRAYEVLGDGSVFGTDATFGFFRISVPGFAAS